MEEKDIPRAQRSHKRGSRVLALGLGLIGGHAESSWRFPGKALWQAGHAGRDEEFAGNESLTRTLSLSSHLSGVRHCWCLEGELRIRRVF